MERPTEAPRQEVEFRPILVFLALLLLALIPLAGAFRGDVIGPFSHIRAMAPWNEAAPATSWDILQADGVLQSYVWRVLVLEAWGSGSIPAWNPYQLMGTPLLANSQSGGFYPPHVLMGLLRVPPGLSMNLMAWLHLAWAAFGVYCLSRKLGAGSVGAWMGASLILFSPFFLHWLPLASVPTTCSWIPWALFFAARIAEGGELTKKLPWRNGSRLGMCLAMMILGGHLQFAFYGIIAVALVGGIEVVRALLARRVGWNAPVALVAGLALGPCLAAPQLLPVLENSKFSHRAGPATAQGYEAYARGGLSWWELPGMIFPSFMGFPGQVSPALQEDKAPAFWPAYVRPGAAAAESAWGIGPLVFGALALLLAKKRKAAGLLAPSVLAVFSLLMALGTPLNALFYFGVPGWSATGSPGRIIVLFVFASALILALAWPKPDEEADPHDIRWAGAGLAAAFVFALAIFQAASPGLKSWAPNLNVQAIAAAQLQAGLLLALGSLAAGAGALYLSLKKGPFLGVAALGALSQLLLGSAFFVPMGKAIQVAPQADGNGLERVAAVNSDWGFLTTPRATAPPNLLALGKIPEVGGYDSLLHRDTVALLNEANGRDSAPETNGNIMHVKPGANLDKLVELGVTEILHNGDPNLPPFVGKTTESLEDGGDGSLLTNGPGRASLSGGKVVRIRNYPSRQVVEIEGGGTLTVRDRRLEGWKAFAQGRELPMEPGPFRVVEAPVGADQVEFRYQPPGMVMGFYLLLAGCFGSVVMLVLSSYSPVKSAKSDQDLP